MNTVYDDIEQYKKQHINHKCFFCEHRYVYAYEDDTPASYTPYHWWLGRCGLLEIDVNSDELPPENCMFSPK